MVTAYRCSHPHEEGLLGGTRVRGKLRELVLYSVEGHNITPTAQPTPHCALQQHSHNLVPKGKPSEMPLPLDGCKRNIGTRDSPETDAKDSEDRSMLLIRQHGPSHASMRHFPMD